MARGRVMAAFTLTASQTYPEGTVVGVYPSEFEPPPDRPPTPASPVASGTMVGGQVTFTGLADGVRYQAHAVVGGRNRYVSFSTPFRGDATIEGLDARDYAPGGAGADSAPGLQRGFNDAAGGSLVVPGDFWRIDSGLVVPPAGLTLVLEEAELNFANLPLNGIGITAAGSLGTPVNLAAAAAPGDLSVSVAAGAETAFVVGQMVKLTSTDVYDPGRTSSLNGEEAVILSLASGVITFRSPIMGTYTTGAQVRVVNVSKLRIRGSGAITGGGAGSQHIPVKASWVHAFRMTAEIEMRGVDNIAVQLFDCADFEVANLDFEGSTAPQGYGVSTVNACQFGRIHHNHFRNCRHATSTNNDSAGGIARHIGYDHNEVRDTSGDAMDCHAAAEYLTWSFNDIYDAGNVGINAECPKASAFYNHIFRPVNNGIYLLNCAAQPGEYRAVGNEVYDSPEYGLQFAGFAGAGASTPKVLDILDNVFFRCAQAGAWADPTQGSYRLKGARMNRNYAYDCAGSGSTAAIYMTLADASEVCNNMAIQQPNGVGGTRVYDFPGGKYEGNLTEFVSAGTTRGHRAYGAVGTSIKGNVTRNAGGVGGVGLEVDSASSGCIIHDNLAPDATTPFTIAGTGHDISGNLPRVETSIPSVASGSSIVLPPSEGIFYLITGSTDINTISPTGFAGKVVMLTFTSTAKLKDATGNLKLGGDYTHDADDGILLGCDGTSWFQGTPGSAN